MEGYLAKKSTGGKWQNRYFELAGHYLKYFATSAAASTGSGIKAAADVNELISVQSTTDTEFTLVGCFSQTGSPTVSRGLSYLVRLVFVCRYARHGSYCFLSGAALVCHSLVHTRTNMHFVSSIHHALPRASVS
jgi:hypothetical protein